MIAKIDGKCFWCGDPIVPGQAIEGRKIDLWRWMHEECAAASDQTRL